MSQLERTFAIIKPDAVEAGHAGEILAMAERAGFRILALRKIRMSRLEAESFYAVHRERSFFPSLVAFMTSGPCVVAVLERDDAITRWRELMGPTDPAGAPTGTIRKLFGTNIERNAVHGSDGPQTAAAEVPFFFGTADLL